MKTDFDVIKITKSQCEPILRKYHYLSNISKGFKSGINYGLIKDGVIVGVIIFTGFPVQQLYKSIFGYIPNDQSGFYELSRLCICPDIQKNEHNIATWFMSRAIKQLKKNKPRVILSYADSDYHNGIVYQAYGFEYYGLTAKKFDFFFKKSDGSYIKRSRGIVKNLNGEWKPRSQKHRYLLIFDKTLKILWKKENFPKKTT